MNDVDEKVDCNVNESKYLPGPGLSLFIQHFITLVLSVFLPTKAVIKIKVKVDNTTTKSVSFVIMIKQMTGKVKPMDVMCTIRIENNGV